MKKKFYLGEDVRKRNTMISGIVKGEFSETEYYVEFEGITRKHSINDLSYSVFKQLFEFIKYADSVADEQMIEFIKNSKLFLKIKIAALFLFASSCIYFVLMFLYLLVK